MTEYGKTENLFTRNEETHKLNIGDFRNPYVRQIKDWLVTEKIDGTNMRIILDWAYDEEEDRWRPIVDVRGRSDKATVPKGFLQEAFGVEEAYELTDRVFRALKVIIHGGESDEELTDKITRDPTMLVIYGEGYGAGIQKGGYYSPTKQFRAFDATTYRGQAEHGHWGSPMWRRWDDVADAAEVIGIKTVPVLSSTAPLEEIVERVPELRSAVAAEDSGVEFENANDLPYAEGVIARTDPYLFDHNRSRVFFKLKREDL